MLRIPPSEWNVLCENMDVDKKMPVGFRSFELVKKFTSIVGLKNLTHHPGLKIDRREVNHPWRLLTKLWFLVLLASSLHFD